MNMHEGNAALIGKLGIKERKEWRMKKFLTWVMIFLLATMGMTLAENGEIEAVRTAYYEAINAEGDGDVKYNELHAVADKVRETLVAGNRSEAEDGCTFMYGDISMISDEELLKKTEDFLEYVVDVDGDKLSALMRRFQSMDSVTGLIEPTTVSIEVNDISQFVTELGLSDKAVGYVLAVVDIYDYSWLGGNELLQFTDTGFTFNWTAVGSYELTLTEDVSVTTIEELARGSKGDQVVQLQERLNELGFSVGTADGSYGKKTEFAVQDFQKRNGLNSTGIADVETQELLYSEDALGTHFGFTIDEFVSRFSEVAEENYRITEENGSYNVYGYGTMDASFAFKTDSLGHVTAISFNGQNLKKNGEEQIKACLYAFGVIHPDLSSEDLVNEFVRIGKAGMITEDGIEYMYLESHKLNVLWFTMEVKS